MTDTLVQNMARLIKIKKADAFKHTQIIEECIQNGTKFTDPDFPPEESSLIRRPETPAKWRTYVWRRASEFMPVDKMSVFQNIDPGDILQGQLGDCYFLSCLSVLAEKPKLIQRLFLTEQPNEAGCYAVWLNDNGEWKNFIVDDYFPCTGPRTGPAFTRSNGFELWVLLLEKAYAKLHGSYDIIEGGDPAWALRDLTGAPWDFLDSPDPNAVWAFIMDSEAKGYLATCYTKSTAIREEQNSLGIVYGHAYSILDAKEIVVEEGTVRLIQIRNPWGKFEWKGDWGDDSDKWTESAKAQVNYENRDDGTFWMNVTDFVNYYEGVGICKLHENYQYKSISFDHKETERNYSICRLVIPEKTHAFLSVNQKDDRGFDPDKNYQYSTMRVMLGKIEENGLTYIDGKFFNDRNLVLENVLEPGYYILVIEMYWRQQFYKTINLSAYSERKIEFEEVARADVRLIEKNLLKSYVHVSQIKKKNYSHLGAENILKYSGSHLGMIFFYYNNQEEDKQLNETVRATKLNNLQIQQAFTDNDNFTVQVLPQDDCVIYYKIVNETEAYAFSPSTSSDIVEPSSEEIEANRHKAYRGTTYIDDPNDKTGESRDVSYYDDYIKNNVDLYPEDPTNMVEIIANKKEPLEIIHPVSNPQKDLSSYHKREGVALLPEAPSMQVSGLFDIKLWRNFPKYLSDDTRLGKWAIQDFERTYCDLVNPVFSSSFADSIFEVLMCLIVVATLLISLLRPQFLDIGLITSLVVLVICRYSVLKMSNNNLVLRVSPFLFFLSCFLDMGWLFVYGKNWPTKDVTDDGMLSGVKSFVILMSVISLISKFIFSLILWWKVILALKTKK